MLSHLLATLLMLLAMNYSLASFSESSLLVCGPKTEFRHCCFSYSCFFTDLTSSVSSSLTGFPHANTIGKWFYLPILILLPFLLYLSRNLQYYVKYKSQRGGSCPSLELHESFLQSPLTIMFYVGQAHDLCCTEIRLVYIKFVFTLKKIWCYFKCFFCIKIRVFKLDR